MPEDKPSLLLVDDSDFSLALLSKALGDTYKVVVANSGAEGLAKLEKSKFDLIITDLLMPQISGLAFLRQVSRRYPDTKVIVCSADVQAETMKKAKALGAAAFLSKPIDPEEVRSVTRLVLSNEKMPRELPISPKYIDAFTEIFNIGVGKAADSLSKLVYEAVTLSVPTLKIFSPDQLADYIANNFTGDVACLRQEFEGAAEGRAYLLLSTASGVNLVNALVQENVQKEQTLTEADRTVLMEIGNILINAVVGTLANTLGVDFNFGKATCDVIQPRAVCDHVTLDESEFVLYVETVFVVPGRQIGGNLAILIGSSGMGSIIKEIDRLM